MDTENPSNKPQKKYVLCRRQIDQHNEVIKAGSKAPSAIGIVDFHTFIRDHCLHPVELAQFLKISYEDIKDLVEHGGWIDRYTQENLINLISLASIEIRRKICGFLMNQEGNAGILNHPRRSPASEKKP